MDDPSFDLASGHIRSALAARSPARLHIESFQRAAVLVPLLRRPEGPAILFTRRAESMQRHKGDISFPGGRIEAGEEPRLAALRETSEEISLDPALVELIGELDERPVLSRYVVTPVVGLVREPPASFVRQEREVQEVFEVPLRLLLRPGLPRGEWWDISRLPPEAVPRPLLDLRDEELDAEGGRYRVWFYDVAPDRVIWGLTARVLKDLIDRALRPI